VRCAAEIQKAMREREGSLPQERRIEVRVRINLGDVIIDEDDVYGDGVNIAARLEALADPGGVVISSAVFEQVRDRVPDSFEDLGDQQTKNIARSPIARRQKRPTQSLLRLGNLEHAGGNRSRPRLAAASGGNRRRPIRVLAEPTR